MFDIRNLGEEKILGGKQSAGQSLADVHPSLLIGRGQKIKTGETKAQRKTDDAARH